MATEWPRDWLVTMSAELASDALILHEVAIRLPKIAHRLLPQDTLERIAARAVSQREATLTTEITIGDAAMYALTSLWFGIAIMCSLPQEGALKEAMEQWWAHDLLTNEKRMECLLLLRDTSNALTDRMQALVGH